MRCALLAAGLLAASGCGKAGPERVDVTGNVTFRGRPVPIGKIVFQPDAAKGNHGPAGFAVIRQGQYTTAKGGRGAVPGPQIVVIEGFDGRQVPGGELAAGQPLFPEYRTTAEVPRPAGTCDFAVPDQEKF